MKLKRISKKLIICLLLFMMIFNFLIVSVNKTNEVFAANEVKTNEELAAEAEEEADSSLGGFLNGLAGILTWPFKLIPNIISRILQSLAYFVIDTAGHTGDVSVFVTPFDIFFNKFTLTNINIFQTDDLQNTSGGDIVYDIREMAAMLYYIVRSVAIGILLIMLLIIGIKMALATLAEEKARLKTMFLDWLVSVGLVLFMHYIILGIITINENLVGLIENVADGADISNSMSSLSSAALSVNFLLGWGATIAYFLITIQIMIFVGMYIVRMFKVIVLIILSPIMPLTYSLDRSKGGPAKAFNGWFREFAYNVFIQVVHCIVYVVVIGVPMSAIQDVSVGSISSLTLPLLLIFAIFFVKKAEEMIKSLFGFDRAMTLTSYSSTVNNATKAVLTGVSIANGTYTVNNNFANNTTKFGSNIQTLGEKASGKLHEYKDRAGAWLANQEQNIESLAGAASGGNANDSGEAVEAEVVEENNTENEEQNPQEPILLEDNEMSDEDTEKVADVIGVSSNNEESTKNKNENINLIDENGESEEDNSEEVVEEKVPLTDEERREREELKELYQRMLDEIKEANETGQEIQTKLEELADQLGEDKVEEITNQIQELVETEGMEAAENYANMLGQTAEGIFARQYIGYLNNRRNLRQLLDAGEGKLINLINDSVEDGVIDSREGIELFNNARKVVNGQEDETDEILGLNDDVNNNDNNSNSKIEVIDGEVVDITDDLKISRATLKSVIASTRRARINNSKILQAIEGDIKVEGDFTDTNLIAFNTKVVEKARTGAYSESNFKKAEEAVKKEGDIAVRRLEKFKAEQSEANARMLTPAGKKYAELMIEAQQASMFIVSSSMSESNSLSEYSNRSSSVTNQNINISGPTNRSNNVLNDLNQRKKYA